MALETVEVRATFKPADWEAGDPGLGGQVEFELNTPLQDAAGNIIYEPVVVVAELDEDGHFAVDLVATDAAGAEPDTAQYQVTHRLYNRTSGTKYRRPPWLLELPAASPGGFIDLADVAAAVSVPAVFTYVLQEEFDTHVNGTAAENVHVGYLTNLSVGDNQWLGTQDFEGDAFFGSGRPWVDVMSDLYGAVGDFATDDTAAILAAYAAVPPGGELFFPTAPKAFRMTDDLPLDKPVTIKGAGWSTNITGNDYGHAYWDPATWNSVSGVLGSVIYFDSTVGTCFDWDMANVQGVRYEKIAIVGPGSGTSKGIATGTPTKSAHDVVYDAVMVANFAHGVEWVGCMDSETRSLLVTACDTGFTFDNASNDNLHSNFKAVNCASIAVWGGRLGLDSCQDNLFHLPLVQGCKGTGFLFENETKHTTIFKPWFENPTVGFDNALVTDDTSSHTVVSNPDVHSGNDKFIFNAPRCRLEEADSLNAVYAGVGVTFGPAAIGSKMTGAFSDDTTLPWIQDDSGELLIESVTDARFRLTVGRVEVLRASRYGIRPLVHATAGRPSAVQAGKGTGHYDSTLNKPIWSDGAAWRDAAGNAV
jgi:hypothetical protein